MHHRQKAHGRVVPVHALASLHNGLNGVINEARSNPAFAEQVSDMTRFVEEGIFGDGSGKTSHESCI